jgi:hypothetical protein
MGFCSLLDTSSGSAWRESIASKPMRGAFNLTEHLFRKLAPAPRNGLKMRLFSLQFSSLEEKMKTISKVASVLTIAAVGLLSPTMASARMVGGFHGGGFHGGGFHGGGFHGGWGGAGLAAGAIGLGLGLAAAAPYGYGYGYGYPYGYDSYAYDGGCYMVREWTPWGPRLVQQCY